MNNQQQAAMLTKVIQKAIDNAWTGFNTAHRGLKNWQVIPGIFGELAVVSRVPDLPGVYEQRASELYLNKDFAKALWGIDLIKSQWFSTTIDSQTNEEIEYWTMRPEWEVHLQQMVISEDPIKYLEENI